MLLVDDYRLASLQLSNMLSEDVSQFGYPGRTGDGRFNSYEGAGGIGFITMGGLALFRYDNFPVDIPYRPEGAMATTNDQTRIGLLWSAPQLMGILR